MAMRLNLPIYMLSFAGVADVFSSNTGKSKWNMASNSKKWFFVMWPQINRFAKHEALENVDCIE